jgi:hypothetical protein
MAKWEGGGCCALGGVPVSGTLGDWSGRAGDSDVPSKSASDFDGLDPDGPFIEPSRPSKSQSGLRWHVFQSTSMPPARRDKIVRVEADRLPAVEGAKERLGSKVYRSVSNRHNDLICRAD